MFSVDNFYNVISNNLLNPLKIHYWYFYPFGTFNLKYVNLDSHFNLFNGSLGVFFWDQEPFNIKLFNDTILKSKDIITPNALIMANSDQCCDVTQSSMYNWNYFFHGFAALDWYRDLYYLNDKNQNFDKVFITVNRLTTQERSYRLSLVAKLIKNGISSNGLISCKSHDSVLASWKKEISDPRSYLTKGQKSEVYEVFSKLDHDLTLDNNNVQGTSSAIIDYDQRILFKRAFCHVITETVFYPDKLHLTEKIFRPIAFLRPFVLVGCKNNLKYLKSYGFETFNQWWDEGYDEVSDHNTRLDMVVSIIKKLNQYSLDDLQDMYNEMLPVLEHNYEHFFGNFKKIIVEEMVDNFKLNLDRWNDTNKIKYNYTNILNFDEIKQRLSN